MVRFSGPYLNILHDVVFGWHHEFHFVSVAVADNAVREHMVVISASVSMHHKFS